MNPVDGSPTDHRYTHLLGVPVSEWIDVKLLADEEGVSIRGLVQQYRLFRHGERHKAETVRARQSLLEERIASLERRLGRLANV